MKLSNIDIVKNDKKIEDFPAVAVEQTNFRISDIIRRNLAGEQVMGTTKLAYDYLGTEEFTSMEVNPFNNPGFDLDDMILLAEKVGKRIDELQDQKGRLDREKLLLEQKIKNAKKPKEVEVQNPGDNIQEPSGPTK